MLTDTNVLPTVWEHAEGSLEREVGGILLGTLDGDHARVQVAIPALRADGHRTHVTFTHEVWEDVHRSVDKDYPDLRIVGWYHSHPGFGIFLSEYDRFIQANFFSGPQQLALVVDPHAGTLGWFGWAGEDIALLSEAGPFAEHANRPSRQGEDSAAPGSRDGDSRRRRAPLVLTAVGLTVSGVIGGYLWGGSSAVTPSITVPAAASAAVAELASLQDHMAAQTEDLAAANAEVAQVREQRDQATAEMEQEQSRADDAEARADAAEADRDEAIHAAEAPVVVIVQPGDSLSKLAKRHYGEADRWPEILQANPEIEDPDELVAYTRIRIPMPLRDEESGSDGGADQ